MIKRLSQTSLARVVAVAVAAAFSPIAHAEDAAMNAVTGPAEQTLLRIESPQTGGEAYRVSGEVRTAGVEEGAYIELLSYFNGQAYFSRTFSDRGPMRRIEGDSDWRAFELPFFPEGAGTPELLELKVVLPGAGTVELRGVELEALPAGASVESYAAGGGWWSPTTGNRVGGYIGALLGVIGTAIGVLVWRKADRRVVLGIVAALIAAGGITLLIGVIALMAGQPYAVYYPLMLLGGITAFVGGVNWLPIKKRYEARELQRLSAMDAA